MKRGEALCVGEKSWKRAAGESSVTAMSYIDSIGAILLKLAFLVGIFTLLEWRLIGVIRATRTLARQITFQKNLHVSLTSNE
jgi:hypothetical protein